jgi:hypothetical protein
MVEPYSELARKLEMLRLVFTDGDVCCAVEENVGGLKDGVGEEAKFERGFIRR